MRAWFFPYERVQAIGCGGVISVCALPTSNGVTSDSSGRPCSRMDAKDVRCIHSGKQNAVRGTLSDADTVRQAFRFVSSVLAAKNLLGECRPRSEIGIINDFLWFWDEGVIGGADAQQWLSRVKMRADSGELIFGRETPHRENNISKSASRKASTNPVKWCFCGLSPTIRETRCPSGFSSLSAKPRMVFTAS